MKLPHYEYKVCLFKSSSLTFRPKEDLVSMINSYILYYFVASMGFLYFLHNNVGVENNNGYVGFSASRVKHFLIHIC